MSLCLLRVISPAGVVHDSDSGGLRMELTEPTTELLIVALGKTYDIKDELRSAGFRWNAVNKVWYLLDYLTTEQYEFCRGVREARASLGVYFRVFKLRDNGWSEISN